MDLLLLLRGDEERIDVVRDDVLVILKILAAGGGGHELAAAAEGVPVSVGVDGGLRGDGLLGLGDEIVERGRPGVALGGSQKITSLLHVLL